MKGVVVVLNCEVWEQCVNCLMTWSIVEVWLVDGAMQLTSSYHNFVVFPEDSGWCGFAESVTCVIAGLHALEFDVLLFNPLEDCHFFQFWLHDDFCVLAFVPWLS